MGSSFIGRHKSLIDLPPKKGKNPNGDLPSQKKMMKFRAKVALNANAERPKKKEQKKRAKTEGGAAEGRNAKKRKQKQVKVAKHKKKNTKMCGKYFANIPR